MTKPRVLIFQPCIQCHLNHLRALFFKQYFLSKKRQSLSTVNSPVEKAAVTLFSCDQCDYNNVAEKGLRQHIRMKHRKVQLEDQLPKPSSPATPPTTNVMMEVIAMRTRVRKNKSQQNPKLFFLILKSVQCLECYFR